MSPLYKYIVPGPTRPAGRPRHHPRRHQARARAPVYYTPWCDEHGKVIDDGTVHHLDDGTFRWTAAEPQLRWFGLNRAGLDVEVLDEHRGDRGARAAGPAVPRRARGRHGRALTDLRYFRRRPASFRLGRSAVQVDVSRTGYTGDLGYELWVPRERALAVWDALMAGRQGVRAPTGRDASRSTWSGSRPASS